MRGDYATCTHCGHAFEPPPGSEGGVVNCPNCGKATEAGGEAIDTLWFLSKAAMVFGSLGLGALVGAAAGPWVGAVTALVAFGVVVLIVRLGT